MQPDRGENEAVPVESLPEAVRSAEAQPQYRQGEKRDGVAAWAAQD